MSLLERRLDNVVHRLGFGQSRAQARQLVRHGHITVNGRRVDIPSYHGARRRRDSREEPGQEPASWCRRTWPSIDRDVPDFLSRSEAQIPEGRVVRLPEADDVSIPVQTQLIVELCSR